MTMDGSWNVRVDRQQDAVEAVQLDQARWLKIANFALICFVFQAMPLNLECRCLTPYVSLCNHLHDNANELGYINNIGQKGVAPQ